jgi:hypothetical protein
VDSIEPLNNPNIPAAIEIVQGLSYRNARKKLKKLWARKAMQDKIISAAKRANAIRQ